MTGKYDVIVVGLGAMGSAAAAHLALRGYRVLGLDAHQRGHSLGSSHGTSRIIREAYNEDPAYVPLVQHAYTLWRDLERRSGRKLFTMTGGISIGTRDSTFVDGAIRSAVQHSLPHETLTSEEIETRFPGFRVPADMMGVLEPRAGILQPEWCVAAHLDLAAEHLAELHHREPMLSSRFEGSTVTVTTVGARYSADRLIVTTGPWASELLGNLHIPLTVRRKVNVHFDSEQPELFQRDRCPVSLWELPEGSYFAIPGSRSDSIKFGRHDGGEPCTPHTIRREVDDAEVAALRGVLERYMPGAAGPTARSIVCMYTMTPDQHFVVDTHPEHPELVFGCGFSGHGFKFAPVIGEILADLAVDGVTKHDIGFLSARRFAR